MSTKANCDYNTLEKNNKDLSDVVVNVCDEEEILKLPIRIAECEVIEGATKIVKAIRPNWELNQVEFKMFTDGLTNKLVGCFYVPQETNGHNNTNKTIQAPFSHQSTLLQMNGIDHGNGTAHDDPTVINGNAENENSSSIFDTTSPENVVLVRVYGNKTDMLIDRKAETRNIRLLHRYGYAPQLFAIFKNGLAYEYVPGRTLNPHTVTLPKIWKLVAAQMARMHKVDCGDTVARKPMLPGTMRRFFDLVPERFSDPRKHERLKDTFLPVQKLRDEFEDLLARLEKIKSPVVFAHNDLLLTNIIYTESLNRVTFIDYEYAAYNFQAFDIGNHFTEFAGIDEIDYSRYPSKEFQLSWLQAYLQEYRDHDQVTQEDIEQLYVQVTQFSLAAHYLWTVWALIQAEHSNIDFDYIQFAQMRYGEYLAKRDQYLSLEFEN